MLALPIPFRLGSLTIAAALGALAVSACSSSESPGANDDGGSSSGQPGKDGGPGSDGGGGADGGGGSDAPSGDGSAGCADTASTVCDGFDQGSTIDAKWTQAATGGSVAIVAEGLSAPNALVVSVNAGAGSVYVEKEFPFTTKVHCELDMKLDAVPTQGDLDLFSITSKTSAGDYYVYFANSSAGFRFAEFAEQLPGGGNVDKKQPITAPPTGSWFHVVFDNDGTSATLTVNGATSTLTGLAQPTGTNRNVQLGTPFSQDLNTAARALYDNVVCKFGN